MSSYNTANSKSFRLNIAEKLNAANTQSVLQDIRLQTVSMKKLTTIYTLLPKLRDLQLTSERKKPHFTVAPRTLEL